MNPPNTQYLCELLSLGKLLVHLLGVVLLRLERSVRHCEKCDGLVYLVRSVLSNAISELCADRKLVSWKRKWLS